VTRDLCIGVVASLLSGPFLPFAALAQIGTPPSESTPAPTAPPVATQPSAKSLEDWRAAIARVPLPKEGCFKSSDPSTQWQEVPWRTAPLRPYPPARGRRPDNVGNGNDVSAQGSGFISQAVGSFDSVVGVTSESGYVNGQPPEVANTFSLQLNTQFF